MKSKVTVFLFFIFQLILFPALTFGMENEVEMADALRANGKIYVVVTVLSVILAGLLIFLMIIDKKVRKLESDNRK